MHQTREPMALSEHIRSGIEPRRTPNLHFLADGAPDLSMNPGKFLIDDDGGK